VTYLGGVNVVGFDKTGTLTLNRLEVKEIYCGDFKGFIEEE
jgi:magnesium-transporting ATPase (P-type)